MEGVEFDEVERLPSMNVLVGNFYQVETEREDEKERNINYLIQQVAKVTKDPSAPSTVFVAAAPPAVHP